MTFPVLVEPCGGQFAAVGASELAGKYANDETLPEICAEAYRQRDAEIPE